VAIRKRRSFTEEFKLAAVSRMAAAPRIVELAEELGIQRKLLYMWQKAYDAGGSTALRRAGRPARGSALVTAAKVASGSAAEDTTQTQGQIAALERKIGQQQLDLDFFRAALRQVRERRHPSVGSGETASTK